MGYNYNINKDIGVIYIVADSNFLEEGIKEFFVEIPEIAHESKIRKVLLDCRKVKSEITMTERFEYASELAKHFSGIKVAAVLEPPLRDPDLFGELVATNRGAIFHVCADMEEACSYLGVEQEQISLS